MRRTVLTNRWTSKRRLGGQYSRVPQRDLRFSRCRGSAAFIIDTAGQKQPDEHWGANTQDLWPGVARDIANNDSGHYPARITHQWTNPPLWCLLRPGGRDSFLSAPRNRRDEISMTDNVRWCGRTGPRGPSYQIGHACRGSVGRSPTTTGRKKRAVERVLVGDPQLLIS
jgi:hypothetical protein